MNEVALRSAIVRWGRSLFERGLTAGSSGNLSVRLDDGGFLFTPTNSCLGFLEPDTLARLDADGVHLDGGKPTKELPLHMAFYRARPQDGAVVHLHSTYATALSCLSDTDPADAIPPITPYVVMRAGTVPVLPYAPPGSEDLVPPVAAHAPRHSAVLLKNHGPVVSGRTLEVAVYAAEEVEEAAKLLIITRGMPVEFLDAAAVEDLNMRYPRT